MNWLLIIAFAYLLNAGAITVDKFLLTKKIPNPAVYTFFVCILSLVVLIMAPFGFYVGTWSQIIIALIAGLFFTGALFFMFKAISQDEISRISPIIGGIQPIFILILASFFLSEWLSPKALIAFFVILAGTILISIQKTGSKRKIKKAIWLAILSSFLFAASYTISKGVFVDQGFISGLIWTRLGAFLGAFLLLFSAINRRDIIGQFKRAEKGKRRKAGGLFIGGQIAGAISALLVYYAIAISPSVAVTNATRGLEYIFLLIIVIALSSRFPKLLGEKLTKGILIQKIIATALIIGGLFLLFV